MNSTATQRAQDKTATGDQSREAADRLAVERRAYKSIIAENTALVLSTDSELFNFLKGMSLGVDVNPRKTAGAR